MSDAAKALSRDDSLTTVVHTSARKRQRFSRDVNALILTLYERGIPPSQISARLGIKVGTVKNKLLSWGVAPQIRGLDAATAAFAQIDKRLPREHQFAEMLSLGFSVKRIGEVMGFASLASANAAFQRIRRTLGEQAK